MLKVRGATSIVVQPRMLQTLPRSCPLDGIELKHRNQKVGELKGAALVPVVLLRQHFDEAPRFQFRYVAQITYTATQHQFKQG